VFDFRAIDAPCIIIVLYSIYLAFYKRMRFLELLDTEDRYLRCLDALPDFSALGVLSSVVDTGSKQSAWGNPSKHTGLTTTELKRQNWIRAHPIFGHVVIACDLAKTLSHVHPGG
jgi:hypothetical protein